MGGSRWSQIRLWTMAISTSGVFHSICLSYLSYLSYLGLCMAHREWCVLVAPSTPASRIPAFAPISGERWELPGSLFGEPLWRSGHMTPMSMSSVVLHIPGRSDALFRWALDFPSDLMYCRTEGTRFSCPKRLENGGCLVFRMAIALSNVAEQCWTGEVGRLCVWNDMMTIGDYN